MKWLFLIGFILASTLGAAERPHKLLRRISAAAVCAISAADLATTAAGTSRGGIEQNRLLSRNGQPLWGRMIGINAGACAGAILASELKRAPTFAVITGNLAFTLPKAVAVGRSVVELRK